MSGNEKIYRLAGTYVGGYTAEHWIGRISEKENMPVEDARQHFQARLADGRLGEAE